MRCCKLIIVSFLTAILFRCSNPSLAGGGTDTESSGGRLIGAVVEIKGMSKNNVQLQLISHNHTPFSTDSVFSTFADDSGYYTFNQIDTGIYNLEAVNVVHGTRLLLQGIHIAENKETRLEPETLQTPGSILIASGSQSDLKKVLFIPGTSISGLIDSSKDTITLDSVPPGILPPVLQSDIAGKDISKLTDTIRLRPAETVTVSAYSQWTNSGKIYINTSSIDLTGDISKFPLLVRLDNTTFDFSQVSADGKGLLFTSSNGRQLPFEIERWDSAGANAAIWVLVDTISVNNSSQHINLYWGNPKAENFSSGKQVFDTTLGFRAVLHINQESSGVRNRKLYSDVTAMANHGDDFVYARGRAGISGYGKNFDYKEEDYIIIDSIKGCSFGTGPFTISFWYKKDYLQKSNLFSFYYGENDTIPFGISFDSSGVISVWNSKDTLINEKVPEDTSWNHLALIRSNSNKLTLYINSTAIKTVPFAEKVNTSKAGMIFIGSDINVMAGRDLLIRSFQGAIDEFRIESVARAENFLKFSYLNQSPAYKLEFEKK